MKKIEKYMSDDGREFMTENDCKQHELLIEKLQKLLSKLPPIPKSDNCEFSNGKGYIQHDPKIFKEVWDEFWKISNINHPIDSYAFWRILDDTDSILYNYGYRYLCTNKYSFKEYGQPYFITHENEVKGSKIN